MSELKRRPEKRKHQGLLASLEMTLAWPRRVLRKSPLHMKRCIILRTAQLLLLMLLTRSASK